MTKAMSASKLAHLLALPDIDRLVAASIELKSGAPVVAVCTYLVMDQGGVVLGDGGVVKTTKKRLQWVEVGE